MKRLLRYLYNGVLLTVVGLLLRGIGVLWNAWIVKRLGEIGIGLFSLIGTVYSLAVTFAMSGIAFSCSRLTARCIGQGKEQRIYPLSVCCMLFGGCFGVAAFLALYTLAPWIGNRLLNDARTVSSLRMLSYSLPAVSVSGALSGYFTGVRRLNGNAAVSVFEQFVSIAVTVSAVRILNITDLEGSCLALCLGSTTGAILSLIGQLAVWRRDVGRYTEHGKEPVLADVVKTAMPIAASAYLRSGLLTVEHLLIPVGLRKSGEGKDAALASYGVIHGMAFSVVMFAQSLTVAFTSLLVPEMAQAQAQADMSFIRRNCCRVLKFTFLFSFLTASVLLSFADDISLLLFGSTQAGHYIRVLSFLLPVMYTDTAVDHLLKGLGQQFWSMCVNILDAACSVLGVWYLLPKYGITGYLYVLFFCEILNASLSLGRLLYITKIRIRLWRWVAVPLLCGSASTLLCYRILTCFEQINSWVVLSAFIILQVGIFGIMAYLGGVIRIPDRLRREKPRNKTKAETR